MDKKIIGSQTAKGGFANEHAIVAKFNDWKNDKEAQDWLLIMGYELHKLDRVAAEIVYRKEEKNIQVNIVEQADKVTNILCDFSKKRCSCPLSYWEVIMVDCDEDFDNKSVVYHHCDLCGVDEVVADFYIGELLYQQVD